MDLSTDKTQRNNYADKEFWNARFTSEKKNDWYIMWKEFKPYIDSMATAKDIPILNVGCGNSYISIDMWKDGFSNVVNIDISDKAVEMMSSQAESLGVKTQFLEMDATKMTFPDDSFEAVIDKGTLDALNCALDNQLSYDLVREMYRVCRVGGRVFIVTHTCPDERGKILDTIFDPSKTRIRYCLQSLSPQVNLVNIMRSKGKGKTMNDIIRDPELFVECLSEHKRDQEEAKNMSMMWRDYNWYGSKKYQELESQITEVEVQKSPVSGQLDPQDLLECEKNSENCTSLETRERFLPRQNYCFIYEISKLSK